MGKKQKSDVTQGPVEMPLIDLGLVEKVSGTIVGGSTIRAIGAYPVLADRNGNPILSGDQPQQVRIAYSQPCLVLHERTLYAGTCVGTNGNACLLRLRERYDH